MHRDVAHSVDTLLNRSSSSSSSSEAEGHFTHDVRNVHKEPNTEQRHYAAAGGSKERNMLVSFDTLEAAEIALRSSKVMSAGAAKEKAIPKVWQDQGSGVDVVGKREGQLDGAWLSDLLHASVFKAAAAVAAGPA